MKLGTLRTAQPDGELIVCSRDLTRAVRAGAVAPTMAVALESWTAVRPGLEALSAELAAGRVRDAFDLDIAKLAAPLPRPSSWIDSSVYLNHMELARKLRGAETPDIYRTEPLLSPRVPSPFLASHDPVTMPPGDVGLDIEGEVAVILDEVPAGVAAGEAALHIALLTLVNDISLRTVLARELKVGKGIFHGKGIPAMAPVAVTPDEFGNAWDGGKVSLPLQCTINGKLLGQPNAGVDMYIEFPAIIADAARLRPLPAGTVLGSGTVSNRDRSAGSACIAEVRMIETLEHGQAATPYLKHGDVLRIEMFDRAGETVFGPIKQTVR